MTSSTGCLIRDACRQDVPAMAALTEEFARYMRDLGDTTELRLDAEALERDGFGTDPAFRGLVAELSGQVVGFLLHHAGYDTDAATRLLFVVDLYVTESARGRGIGAALINEARRAATAAGATQLVWTVDRRNALARRFYEGIGARYVEELDLMYLHV
jgi:GNAT superfamily N-acetyltransferase